MAFFTYSKYGIAIYVDKNGDINVYRGNQIDLKNEEVRELFRQGYTQVRMVDGVPIGFFNINDIKK